MISLKSKLLNATLAVTAAIPLAAAGLFTSPGSAQAAALVGKFSLVGNGSASLLENSLTFNAPNTFNIISPTNGNFTDFNTGAIGNILSFAPTSTTNPFLDMGINSDANSIIDGLNVFTATSAKYTLNQTDPNFVTISVITDGFFNSALGDISQGRGIFTLQADGTIETIEANWKKGIAVETSYSSLYFATVPEPAALLGLGAVGAVMAISRRRKSILQ